MCAEGVWRWKAAVKRPPTPLPCGLPTTERFAAWPTALLTHCPLHCTHTAHTLPPTLHCMQAIFYDPAHLPVTGLNPEGTPWYLAPECCRAKWWPASDVWAVGVMACYLLSGAYPFLDRVSPKMPDLARTLRWWVRWWGSVVVVV